MENSTSIKKKWWKGHKKVFCLTEINTETCLQYRIFSNEKTCLVWSTLCLTLVLYTDAKGIEWRKEI